ncbi:hypothetical protein [Sphingobium agri]|uniref:Uncharacterized protein n=1 Tax=Sphingobium agri TaxID=2933566 RepID=A0ABT0E206_9SPHN|nr:hypothetical protein [Sphingobium agri]MCK0533407.1 hypothetical protein [Sphingobium agri]
MARSIILHAAALDRSGGYRDAGATLTVGADDDTQTDIGETAAGELVAADRAIWAPEPGQRKAKA